MHGAIAERYRDFAAFARDDSPCFEAWALEVAADPDVQAWLADLPRVKQQPNLVFAAARWHGAPAPGPYHALREVLLGNEDVKATIMARSTQTNEAGRLATLTPVLAAFDGPLALVEVGASAGLCLYPDRYDYRWSPLGDLAGSGGPTLTCTAEGAMPVPARRPEVAWRGGVDLNPLDLTDVDATDWLTTLVWPEQEDRRALLRAAIDIARADPPHLVRGDLLEALPGLLQEASLHGVTVVLHSSVVAYLDHDERERFAETMRGHVASGRCHWVANEAPGIVPGIDPPEPRVPARFVLARDGTPVAWAHGHGRAISWL